MRLVFAEPAADDLEKIVEYIAFDNPEAAKSVYEAIMSCAERLIAFPKIGGPSYLP